MQQQFAKPPQKSALESQDQAYRINCTEYSLEFFRMNYTFPLQYILPYYSRLAWSSS